MKVYDTSYPPDTFGRIRMGFIKEMYLTYSGFSKPVSGDHLRISCVYQGVVRDVITIKIISVVVSVEVIDTVLIKVDGLLADMAKFANNHNTWLYNDHLPRLQS